MRAGSSIFGSWASTTSALRASSPIRSSAWSGQARTSSAPGKRSRVANPSRGSMMVAGRPTSGEVRASTWAMCTAPTTSSLRGTV